MAGGGSLSAVVEQLLGSGELQEEKSQRLEEEGSRSSQAGSRGEAKPAAVGASAEIFSERAIRAAPRGAEAEQL